MKKIGCLALAVLVLLSFVAMMPLSAFASESPFHLMVVEWYGRGRVTFNAIPPSDNSMSNQDYKLLPFHWYTTAEYWINPTNGYGFSDTDVVNSITIAANT